MGNIGSLNELFWQHGFASFLEIITGAGLFLGLFTWPLGLLSIILTIVAWSTNGFDMTHWFIILSSLAVMNGSGRGFGLDFYVVPFLQKTLGGLWYGKAKSTYNELEK